MGVRAVSPCIGLLVLLCLGLVACERNGAADTLTTHLILSELENPRGVAIGEDGTLYVAQAGTGYDAVDPTENTGKLSRFEDVNGDGDYEDVGEETRYFSHMPTYNALHFFRTGRDEVNGPGDLLLHPDGRLFLSVDGGLDDVGLREITPEGRAGRTLADRSNMNGIAFSPDRSRIYMAESTANSLSEVTLEGEYRVILNFPALAHEQQAVPAGVASDPRTGDLLVALFSGTAVDEDGEPIPIIPGDSKVVRVDPSNGELSDEITGLTTAIDVAVDADGNIYVVEMTDDYADILPDDFELYDPDAPPLHGGYRRFAGRVTRYGPEGEARVLAEGLDMPTNITLAPDGSLFVSLGQGTPGRPIPGPEGATRVSGSIIQIMED